MAILLNLVKSLLFNLLFIESIHSLLFRHIIIFLNHGQYTPRDPDHYMAKGKR